MSMDDSARRSSVLQKQRQKEWLPDRTNLEKDGLDSSGSQYPLHQMYLERHMGSNPEFLEGQWYLVSSSVTDSKNPVRFESGGGFIKLNPQ